MSCSVVLLVTMNVVLKNPTAASAAQLAGSDGTSAAAKPTAARGEQQQAGPGHGGTRPGRGHGAHGGGEERFTVGCVSNSRTDA
jgi:hypothetical protein